LFADLLGSILWNRYGRIFTGNQNLVKFKFVIMTLHIHTYTHIYVYAYTYIGMASKIPGTQRLLSTILRQIT
jgi:hypothetical protein